MVLKDGVGKHSEIINSEGIHRQAATSIRR